MARIIHVERAQQRYATRPVIDPATGQPKKTPMMKNGEQMRTKHGQPIFLTVTEKDREKPLPLLVCDACGKPIELGTPYKHVTTKTTYGGRTRNRHESCPTWQPWELSNSWSARVAQATFDFDVSNCETPDEVQAALDEVADRIQELAEESREAAESIENGFGHPTFVSDEANERADQLEEWAEEIRGADIPELPEPEEDEDGETPTEPSEDQMNEWRSDVESACDIVNNSPI